MNDPQDPYAVPDPEQPRAHPQEQGTAPLPIPYSTGTPVDPPAPYASYAPPSSTPDRYPSDPHPSDPYQPAPVSSYPPSAPRGYPPPAPGHQPPAPHPYGAPGFPYQSRRTNGMAVASLVLGILWLWWVGSILALVFGYVALGQIARAPADAPQDGRGLAVAGVVLGWVGVATLLLLVIGLAAVGV